MDDFASTFTEIQDYLAPRLDTYEQAIYLYLFRHSHLEGTDTIVVGFKSARRRMACGVGENGKPMSENTAYKKLESLRRKGCIQILDSTREGRKIRVFLPRSIEGVYPKESDPAVVSLEDEDFFMIEANRQRILARDEHCCFYCRRALNPDNFVIEHVVSRPEGDNSYRNLVAACRECNNRKGAVGADEWLRSLYQESILNSDLFKERLHALEYLQAGQLVPPPAAG